MEEILHDRIYANHRNHGSMIYTGSCRIDVINSIQGLLGFVDYGYLSLQVIKSGAFVVGTACLRPRSPDL